MTTLRVELERSKIERILIKIENLLFEQSEDITHPEGPSFDLWLEAQLGEVVQELKHLIDFKP